MVTKQKWRVVVHDKDSDLITYITKSGSITTTDYSLIEQIKQEGFDEGLKTGHGLQESQSKRIKEAVDEARVNERRNCGIELERTMALCTDDGSRIYSLIEKWKKSEIAANTGKKEE